MKLETRIAERLKVARAEAGLSLEALGVAVGIEEETAKVRIHQYEQGKHLPPYSMLERLSEVLNKPITWFVCDDEQQSMMLTLERLGHTERKALEVYVGQLVEGQTTKTR